MEHLSNSKELFRTLVSAVTLHESKDEVESTVLLLLEKRCRLKRAEILSGNLTHCDVAALHKDLARINDHEPIQYVIGVADFFGREFIVDPSVLIPRPETEELVREAMKLLRTPHLKVLDIGTGSGCIATTLALESNASVTAIDISEDALRIAKQNADRLGAAVEFIRRDFLMDPLPGSWDVIVSNPPYVRRSEQSEMNRNVTQYEPHLALFVPDNDPLIFYKALAAYGSTSLNRKGFIVAELNENLATETATLFDDSGYTTSLVTDLSGKLRIIVAARRSM